LPGVNVLCRIKLNPLSHKNFRLTASRSSLPADAGCWCTE
jgi:hypothetical protein